MQLLGGPECLSTADNVRCGELMFERAKKLGSYWSIGRMGARTPLLHAEATEVVPTAVASGWLERTLALDWAKAEGVDVASASLAHLTGEADRNVGQKMREQVVAKLRKAGAAPGVVEMVTRPRDLSPADMRRMFGESLPAGLRLT